MDPTASNSKPLGPFTWKGRVYGVPTTNTTHSSSLTSSSALTAVVSVSPSTSTSTPLVETSVSSEAKHQTTTETNQTFKLSQQQQQQQHQSQQLTTQFTQSSPPSSPPSTVQSQNMSPHNPSSSMNTSTTSTTRLNPVTSQLQLLVSTNVNTTNTNNNTNNNTPSISSLTSSSSSPATSTTSQLHTTANKRKLDPMNSTSEPSQKKRIVQALRHDLHAALQPAYKQPLRTLDDVWRALLPFHIFQSEVDLNENTPPRKRRSSLRRVPSSETKRQAHELVTRTECLLHKFHRNFMSDRVEPWQEEHLLMQRLLYAEERQEFEQLKGLEMQRKQQLLQQLQLQRQQQQQATSVVSMSVQKGSSTLSNHFSPTPVVSSSLPSSSSSLSSLMSKVPLNSMYSTNYSSSVTTPNPATSLTPSLMKGGTSTTSFISPSPSSSSSSSSSRVNTISHLASAQSVSHTTVQTSSSLSSETQFLTRGPPHDSTASTFSSVYKL